MRSTKAQRDLTDQLLRMPGVDGNILILDRAWRMAMKEQGGPATKAQIQTKVRDARALFGLSEASQAAE